MTTAPAWQRIASEGETVTVEADSTVRYGASAEANFVERLVSGSVTASNGFFGSDPAPNRVKGLWIMAAGSAPAPAPAPVGPDAPLLPKIDDPDFDRKMRLVEFEQRERSIKASISLKAVNDQLRASNDRMSGIVGRHVATQEQLLRDGIPSDSDLVAAVDRLTQAVKG